MALLAYSGTRLIIRAGHRPGAEERLDAGGWAGEVSPDGMQRLLRRSLRSAWVVDGRPRPAAGRWPGGKAAVGVLAPVSEAKLVADKLTELGGAAETHEVSDEALEEAHAAATTDQEATTDQATSKAPSGAGRAWPVCALATPQRFRDLNSEMHSEEAQGECHRHCAKCRIEVAERSAYVAAVVGYRAKRGGHRIWWPSHHG